MNLLRFLNSTCPPFDQTLMSAEESRRFLQTLDAPFQPNAKLKSALERVERLSEE